MEKRCAWTILSIFEELVNIVRRVIHDVCQQRENMPFRTIQPYSNFNMNLKIWSRTKILIHLKSASQRSDNRLSGIDFTPKL